jgi:acyl-CoA synthetase (AMP-forming)/AMP-acid ligase II
MPPDAASRPARLIEVLKRRAAAHPQRLLYTFYDEKLTELSRLTYGGLEERSLSLAHALMSRRDASGRALLRAGDAVVLVFTPSLDFIVSLVACLRAGVLAVPAYPPDPRNMRVNLALFAAVCASSGARVALSHRAYTGAMRLAELAASVGGLFSGGGGGGAAWPELSWLGFEELSAAAAAAPAGVAFDAAAHEDLAFLQFTSGSTSEPKGVMVTHGALAHNLTTIVRSLRAGADTVVASWLPQYHDMGLVGAYLGVAYCGGRGVYMSPLSFLKAPLAWLELASRARATHVQAPNFAFALTARRAREARAPGARLPPPALDLSALRHVFNAAEPITARAMSDFTAAFARDGFRARAWAPGFGLAESTVYVSDGGSFVAYVDRDALEAAARARVLGTCSLLDLGTPAELAAAAAAAAAAARAGSRVAALVSCGPVSCPAGLQPMASSRGSTLAGGPVEPAAPAAAPRPTRAAPLGPASPPPPPPPPPSVPSLLAPPTSRLADTAVEPPPVPSLLTLRAAAAAAAAPAPAAGGGAADGPNLGGAAAAKNPDVWVLVVNPETSTPLGSEGSVGEVWVHSASLAAGYWRAEDATRAAFRAHLAVPPGSDAGTAAAAAEALRAAYHAEGYVFIRLTPFEAV